MVDANSHDATPGGTIFISYSRRDEEFADRLAASLRDRGFEALIDRRDIRALEDWRERIRTLIAQADTVVFVLSPDAVASPICQEEVDFAAVLNKRFAPILHRQVSARTVPVALARLNWVAFDNPAQFEDGLARLVDALNTDITWIRKHTELGLAARRWEAAGRPGPSGLMLRPPLLDEAEGWVAWQPRDAPAPTESISAFIAMSREVFAHEQAARKADIDRYLLSQSRFMADLANQHRRAGDCAIAMALAIEALPRAGDPDARPHAVEADARPHAVEAERALFSALERLQETRILPGHSGPVVFGPD